MSTPASLVRLEQKLKREELKLARLKSQQDENRVRDTRLKYRLGGLIFLLGWERWDHARLDERLASVRQQLADGNQIDQFQAQGEAEFLKRENQKLKVEALSTSGLNEKQRLELNHQVIELGGMMVKHGFEKIPRNAVLGALIVG